MMIRIAAIGYLGGNNCLSGPVLGAFIMLPIIYFFSSFFPELKATNFFYGLYYPLCSRWPDSSYETGIWLPESKNFQTA